MLKPHYHKNKIEAGCDEAGRTYLSNSKFAATVILAPNYKNKLPFSKDNTISYYT